MFYSPSSICWKDFVSHWIMLEYLCWISIDLKYVELFGLFLDMYVLCQFHKIVVDKYKW